MGLSSIKVGSKCFYNWRVVMFLIALGCATSTHAQGGPFSEANEVVSEAWLALKLRKKINKKWSFRLRTEARVIKEKNDVYFLEPSIRYKITDNLNFTGGYRMIGERKKNGTRYRNRANIGIVGHGKINDLALSMRVLYTDRIDVQGFGVGGNKLRFKLDAEYEIIEDRLSPFVGAELFRELGALGFEKIRYIMGLQYELSDRYAINASYRHEDFLDEASIVNIAAISLKYKL